MRAKCRREDLRRGLHGTLPGAAVVRQENTILTHVHIETAKNALVLTTYNREWWMRKSVEARVEESGVLVVPAKLVTDVVDALASAELQLEAGPDTNELVVTGDDGELGIRCGFVQMYPHFPQLQPGYTASVDVGELVRAVQQTAVAAARTLDQSALAGVHLRFESGHLVMAASDGSRLAEHQLRVAPDTNELVEFTLPAAAIRELHQLLAGESGPVRIEVAVSGNLASFAAGHSQLVASIWEGSYPNYAALIPVAGVSRTRVLREDLLARLRAALLLAPSEGSPLSLRQVGADRLVLSIEGSQRGSGRLEVSATNEPPEAQVLVDGAALRAGLEAMDTVSVDVFVGNDQHLVVRSVPGDDHLYLVVHKQRPPSIDFQV